MLLTVQPTLYKGKYQPNYILIRYLRFLPGISIDS